MPATDLTPYCADCDLSRQAALEGAETEAERAVALRDHPRRMAPKKDIDGTPLCVKCLEHRREGRRIDLLERQQALVAALPATLAELDKRTDT